MTTAAACPTTPQPTAVSLWGRASVLRPRTAAEASPPTWPYPSSAPSSTLWESHPDIWSSYGWWNKNCPKFTDCPACVFSYWYVEYQNTLSTNKVWMFFAQLQGTVRGLRLGFKREGVTVQGKLGWLGLRNVLHVHESPQKDRKMRMFECML